MEKEKKSSIFIKILAVLLFLYIILFVLKESGYYERKMQEKVAMTKDQIAVFESDIANNVATDIIDYLPKEKDYSSVFTKGANDLANNLGNAIDNNFKGIFAFIKSLFIG